MTHKILIVDDEPNIVMSIEFLLKKEGFVTETAGDGDAALEKVRSFVPDLVLLDEPSEGVPPLIVPPMARTIRALKAQGVSVLLSEQNLPFAEAVADRAYLIEQGQVVHEGRMADVVANPDVRKNCLGV